MRYRSAAAFRQALGDQIRREARTANLPAQWLWKVIAFERMLARLVERAPGAWILKGGFALDLRLGNRARTTRDVDLA